MNDYEGEIFGLFGYLEWNPSRTEFGKITACPDRSTFFQNFPSLEEKFTDSNIWKGFGSNLCFQIFGNLDIWTKNQITAGTHLMQQCVYLYNVQFINQNHQLSRKNPFYEDTTSDNKKVHVSDALHITHVINIAQNTQAHSLVNHDKLMYRLMLPENLKAIFEVSLNHQAIMLPCTILHFCMCHSCITNWRFASFSGLYHGTAGWWRLYIFRSASLYHLASLDFRSTCHNSFGAYYSISALKTWL